MTNERNTPGAGVPSDERVTGAYRDLATERTPERLDEAVLRNAERAARPAYKRSILWTRPAAWAAVVAICLAITLQVTQLPTPTDMPAATELLQLDGAADTPDKKEQEQYRDRQISEDLPAGSIDGDSISKRRIEPETRAVETAGLPESSAEAIVEENARVLADDFEMQDADMLQRAEDMLRLQTGDNKTRELEVHEQDERQSVTPSASGFAAASAPARLDAAGCSTATRQNPDDWLDCILALERMGQAEEAVLQREQLAEAFPDFEIPPRE